MAEHGTLPSYRGDGCRCPRCREANAADSRRRRLRHKKTCRVRQFGSGACTCGLVQRSTFKPRRILACYTCHQPLADHQLDGRCRVPR